MRAPMGDRLDLRRGCVNGSSGSGGTQPCRWLTVGLGDVPDDASLKAVLLVMPVSMHHRPCHPLPGGGRAYVRADAAGASHERAAELIDRSFERKLALVCGNTFLYGTSVPAVRQRTEHGLGAVCGAMAFDHAADAEANVVEGRAC